jgi:hypothetical protein
MHSRIFLLAASHIALITSLCLAITPPGFQPSSTSNLTVTFGSLLAVDGVYITEIRIYSQTSPDSYKSIVDTMSEAAYQPQLYTDKSLPGTYTILMVDPDNPPANASSTSTEEFLHWIQPGLVSSKTASIINGRTVYELINPQNISAFAPYLPPGPPFQFPFIHRYIQLLLDTTSTPNNSVLAAAAQNRRQFHVLQVVNNAGVSVVAGNWFNSSDPKAVAGNSSGNGNATATGTGKPAVVTTNSAGALSGWKGVGMECLVLAYVFGCLLL